MINFTVKRIIDSRYFRLGDVHKFNKFIKTLESQIGYSRQVLASAENLITLLNISKPYEKIEDFVPGSLKSIKLINDYSIYEGAQKVLSKLQHTNEMIVNEDYPERLQIYKNTYKEMCYEQGYEGEEDREYERTYIFFTKESKYNYGKQELIHSFRDIYLPYVNNQGINGTDLIEGFINEHNSLWNQYLELKLCIKLGITHDAFRTVFGYHVNFDNHKNEAGEVVPMPMDSFAYRDRVFHSSQVISFIEEAKVHKATVKLTRDDKFIEYPRGCYMDILMGIESGMYVVYEEPKTPTLEEVIAVIVAINPPGDDSEFENHAKEVKLDSNPNSTKAL